LMTACKPDNIQICWWIRTSPDAVVHCKMAASGTRKAAMHKEAVRAAVRMQAEIYACSFRWL
jgi:hypothetical protein